MENIMYRSLVFGRYDSEQRINVYSYFILIDDNKFIRMMLKKSNKKSNNPIRVDFSFLFPVQIKEKQTKKLEVIQTEKVIKFTSFAKYRYDLDDIITLCANGRTDPHAVLYNSITSISKNFIYIKDL